MPLAPKDLSDKVIEPIHRVIKVNKLETDEKETEKETDKKETEKEMDEKEDDEKEPGRLCPVPNWLYNSIPHGWKSCLSSCESALQNLSNVLSTKEFLPAKEDIWAALTTPLESIRVVILGQDPYPTPGHACGLSFSVQPNVRPLPRSLINIYKELQTDMRHTPPSHGSLLSWSKQGVLLLNTVLTVEAHAAQSHAKIGWEEITDQIIRTIAARTKNIVFVLWGKSAQVKKKVIAMYLDMNQHRVFESAHPSPLSSKKFFGTRPFSTVNTWLTDMGKDPIDWLIL
jgi:uracil-DNA glycosylase